MAGDDALLVMLVDGVEDADGCGRAAARRGRRRPDLARARRGEADPGVAVPFPAAAAGSGEARGRRAPWMGSGEFLREGERLEREEDGRERRKQEEGGGEAASWSWCWAPVLRVLAGARAAGSMEVVAGEERGSGE